MTHPALDRDYRDRLGDGVEEGCAIKVRAQLGEVMLELGFVRSAVAAFSTDAWAALSPAEARQVADDLYRASRDAERQSGHAD